MPTCDRCHRPKAASKEAFDALLEWGGDECLVNSAFGVSGPNEAADCAAARDAWQVAEIARLRATIEAVREACKAREPQPDPFRIKQNACRHAANDVRDAIAALLPPEGP